MNIADKRSVIGPKRQQTRGRNSVVECQLPKLDVEGSNPFARFCPKLMEVKYLRLAKGKEGAHFVSLGPKECQRFWQNSVKHDKSGACKIAETLAGSQEGESMWSGIRCPSR